VWRAEKRLAHGRLVCWLPLAFSSSSGHRGGERRLSGFLKTTSTLPN
jgi:hypothetical protein